MSLLQLLIPRGWWRNLRDPRGPGVRFAVCHTCRLFHPLGGDVDARFADFAHNHLGHLLELLKIRNPDDYGALLAYAPNADVKQAFQGAQTMTVTNLHSLAASATNGWESDAVANTSALYLDDLWQVTIAAVNTVPSAPASVVVLAGHSIDGGTTYTRPFTGTQGTRTFDSIATLAQCAPTLGIVPYATQNTTLISKALSMAATCDNFVLPERTSIGILNQTGTMTFAASGNVVKHNGVYRTVI